MGKRGSRKKQSGLTAEQDTIVDHALSRIETAIKGGAVINSTYITEYKRFIIWVMKNGLRPDAKNYPYRFTTRKTVDAYYIEDVPLRELATQNSLSRIRQSIEKIRFEVECRKVGDETEDPLMEGEELKMVIANHIVEEGERQQKSNYDSQVRQKFGGTDPFKGLKADLLTNDDKRKLLKYIMTNRHQDWNDIGCSFNWGCNGGVRGDSTRSLKLKDLYVSHGFAPGQGKSLTIVLRKEEQKVHFQSDRLV